MSDKITGNIRSASTRDKIIIRPIAGSRRFAPANTVLNYEVNNNGRTEVVKSDLYKGQKIPGSQQGIKLTYSEKNRTYVLDLKYLEAWGGLQQHVEDLAFTYPSGPKVGEVIATCNLSNRLDPFIVELRNRRPYMEEGEIVLFPDQPLDRLFIAFKRMDRDFSDNVEQLAGRNIVSVGTKYQMITESMEITKKAEESNRKEKAFADLMELRKKGDDYARKIAIICGASTEIARDSKTLYPFLVEYLDNTKMLSKVEKMLTQQDFFIKLCGMPGSEIEMLYLLQVGRSKGIIKYQTGPSGAYYSYNKKPIGTTIEEVFNFFQNGDNIDLYEELKQATANL